jgi:predicted DNA-binding transcriptional regulator YafY
MDIDRKAIRLFKLSRFLGDIVISKKKNEFEIPQDFVVSDHLPKENLEIIRSAKVNIRKDLGVLLRNRGKLLKQGDEFDTYELNYENEIQFLREIIWHGTNVKILEPADLQKQLLHMIGGVLH